MNNQFSQKVSEVIIYSKEEANRLKNGYIGPEHLLLGLIRDGESRAIEVLNTLHIDLNDLKKRIESILKFHQDDMLLPDADIPLSNDTARILKLGILEAHLYRSNVADTEHLILAILKDRNNTAATILGENSIDYKAFLEHMSYLPDVNASSSFSEDDEEEDDMEDSRASSSSGSIEHHQTQAVRKPSNDTPALDNFGVDMTKAAQEGRLDPVVGREKEIERLAQILSRRKKNNPVLIGEPGVGKSAIVEGLALRIIQKKVSRILFDKRVVALDMTSIVAGTKYRGQFEERIRTILLELQNNPNVIVFIDEIHTIVGAGSAAGSMDAANMLKPALARGEIQCIGATTLDEYRKNIEKDGALERRFQKVLVEPTTPDETIQILRNIKEKYEDHHNVNYTEAALLACVKLTDRYITDRNFPDKAIDVLDESGSRIHLTNITVPKEIEDQEKLIEETKQQKTEAVKLQNYELAASFRDKEKMFSEQLEQMKKDWEATLKDNRQTVDEEDIANVVSMMSGVPVQRMAQAEGVKLVNMKTDLKSKVVAQDAAIDKLVKAILRSRVGLKDPNKPIGVFMFLGPTGVGKTHLAKELAKYMFGTSEALIRIDMSEFMEKFTVSRLVGAPPGYVGYEEGGQLTEKVRRKPYSIVLLDEIEKAHADVFNLLLQVMDEGRLTDSYGRMVDFKNTVIIMTSNIGTRQLKDFGRGVGFATQSRLDDKEFSRSVIQKALNKFFAPEFLNRVDELVTFDQLSLDAIIQIVDIELKGLCQRVQNIGYSLAIDEEAKKFIATKGYDIQYGARPLKRAIQTLLEDPLSEMIITSDLQEGDIIKVTFNSEMNSLDITRQGNQ
ncbi:ATP-dependent Clp protease ATP-binding subunit [Bacteroides graminisolvens]|uniref:ATP-dependent Clp protease ATP-binding subunit ClpA n=1 Tax=Bacteroides graminisolvens DSM 19988 = JCM 15093 TaxID=1121097 RepID=A0A069D706_9BACE|nr:ATP-dependent Clp protease ATP-binding subunit [Bacteroides graminisolvens]TXH57282.1 MAG: ATP-dependent Clp protease ATP-binding subunit [Bacteroidia bacterium]GAK38207.1 ATP-dependent Clp protease ATP-binding subunit ClpA [Bacteroides graminisolvens DSM 19988 = JCM 15093]